MYIQGGVDLFPDVSLIFTYISIIECVRYIQGGVES